MTNKRQIDEEPVPQATGAASDPGKDRYREMTIAQKLNRADELLKQYEGTDKYDAFKKRVDAMKHKYGEIASLAPDAKWNYDEASQAGGQKGLPDLQPNVQIEGSSVTPNYDSIITKRQNYLDWYSKRGWDPKFVSKLSGQDKQLADTAERAKDDIAYLKGMKNALGYAIANPERARALGALITPRQFFKDGSPRSNSESMSFVWNENLGQFTVVPSEIKIKPREPMQEVQQDAKGGDTNKEFDRDGVAKDVKRLTSALDVVGDGALAYSIANRAMKNRIATNKAVPIKFGLAGQLATAGVSTAADQAADFVDTYRILRATPSDVAQAVRATLGQQKGWRNIGRGLAAAVLDAGNYILPGDPLPDGDRIRETMEDAKGGDTHKDIHAAAEAGDSPRRTDLSNFLATDEVPETLFGIPIVASPEQYTEADIAFFKEHPRAGGFYELGDEDTDTQAATGAEGTSGELPRYYKVQPAASQSGRDKRVIGFPESEYEYAREKNPTRIDPNDIKGTGVSFTDADRVRIPKGHQKEYEKWLDRIAALDPTMKEQRLVPPDWRTNPEWKEFQRDYDYGAAFMAGAEVPTVKASDGRYHLSDVGKLPTHPTFSTGSYYARDPRWSGLAGEWTKEGNYVPGAFESRRGALQAPPVDIKELWNRAVKSTGDLNGMARVFAAMSGEGALNQRGATAGQISNGHLARLLTHANETDRFNGNPANSKRRTVLDTVNKTSHVLSEHEWGTGPGSNWFDASKMEPRFDLINADPIALRTARDLIMNVARFLNGDLHGKDWLPSDAISYGDGPKGLMPDREEIKPTENRIGPTPRGFRIGRKKGK